MERSQRPDSSNSATQSPIFMLFYCSFISTGNVKQSYLPRLERFSSSEFKAIAAASKADEILLSSVLAAIAPSPHPINSTIDIAADSLLFFLFQSNHRLILELCD
jgi:hypothetical protein